MSLSREAAETIKKIALQRRALLEPLKTAVEHADPAWVKDLTLPNALREVLRLARQTTGLDRPDEEIDDESHSADPRIH